MSAYSVEEVALHCPYCGEPITVVVDTSALEDVANGAGSDAYIEDCQVCCRPIRLQVSYGSGGALQVQGFDENDV